MRSQISGWTRWTRWTRWAVHLSPFRPWSPLGLFLLFGIAVPAIAQQPDTTKKAPAPKQVRPGFELPDSLYIAVDTTHSDVDTIVRYTAKDSTTFDVAVKRMTLVHAALLQFQNRELKAP